MFLIHGVFCISTSHNCNVEIPPVEHEDMVVDERAKAATKKKTISKKDNDKGTIVLLSDSKFLILSLIDYCDVTNNATI